MRPISRDEAESIGIEALSFLGADGAQFERFMALSGIEIADLRRSAADPGFLAAVLDYLGADETLLLTFAENAGLAPQIVASARATLAGPPPSQST